MSMSRIFFAAADAIEERGWYRGGWMPPGEDPATCPVCVLAALNVAVGHRPDQVLHPGGIVAVAAIVLGEHLGKPISRSNIVGVLGDRWNDVECETADQVTLALREAAQIEAEAGR